MLDTRREMHTGNLLSCSPDETDNAVVTTIRKKVQRGQRKQLAAFGFIFEKQ
jgi:hypothetical protein